MINILQTQPYTEILNNSNGNNQFSNKEVLIRCFLNEICFLLLVVAGILKRLKMFLVGFHPSSQVFCELSIGGSTFRCRLERSRALSFISYSQGS